MTQKFYIIRKGYFEQVVKPVIGVHESPMV